MRSSLVHIEPENLTVIPSELNFNALEWDEWEGNDCKSSRRISLTKLFMELLSSVKLYGYFTKSYTRQVDILFKNIMGQNPDVQHMRWYFECTDFPYTVQINRDDLLNDCATTYTLGYEHYSVYYYTMNEEGFVDIDKEKLIHAWKEKKYLDTTLPIIEKNLSHSIGLSKMLEKMFEKMFKDNKFIF